jgi:Mlc titration factor MtfA (ptsG expression regulator)
MLNSLKHFLRPAIAPESLDAVAAKMPLLQRLDSAERQRLITLAGRFLQRKTIEGAGGLRIDDRMRALVALQAVVPVLNLALNLYRGWHAVILYADEFDAPFDYADAAGVVHQGQRQLAGEAWQRGPVILAWTHVERDALQAHANGNVVIHELAHKLDMGNGEANGMPPLHRHMPPAIWSQTLREAFDRLKQQHRQGIEIAINPYALESPAEFFAVTSELFFVWPQRLLAVCPEVFRQLNLYYQQQPLRYHAATARPA